MTKIVINSRIINEIKDFGVKAFHNERSFNRFDAQELQIYLFLQGLERVLLKNGIDPGFEIPVMQDEDSQPIDDSGLE